LHKHKNFPVSKIYKNNSEDKFHFENLALYIVKHIFVYIWA